MLPAIILKIKLVFLLNKPLDHCHPIYENRYFTTAGELSFKHNGGGLDLFQEINSKGIMSNIKNTLLILPVPASGLMLGLASAGNMLSPYGAVFKYVPGFLSVILLAMLLVKIFCYTDAVQKDLQHPAIAGVAGTFPMGLVILSTYLRSFSLFSAYIVCGLGVMLHVFLIIYFTRQYMPGFTLEKALPSCFVVYVGIAAFSIVAPVFQAEWMGRIFFWFGVVSYMILLPIISFRVLVIKTIPEPLIPTLAIFAAPASLCLTGYLNSFPVKQKLIVWVLLSLSIIMLTAVLLYMPKMLTLGFLPSCSAFTFPFVISAVALKAADSFFISIGWTFLPLMYIARSIEFLAIFFLLYVLARYARFFIHARN